MTIEEIKEYEQRVKDLNDILLICTKDKLQFATDVYQYISLAIEGAQEKLKPTLEDTEE